MAAKAQKANPDGYVHARDANEYQRLRDQASMWQRATEEVLDRVGLKPGMNCLDVGSGPGSVMRLMAEPRRTARPRHRHRDRPHSSGPKRLPISARKAALSST